MARGPKNLPDREDRVKLRGRERRGKLLKMDDEILWCTVQWDDSDKTTMCHLYELEKDIED